MKEVKLSKGEIKLLAMEEASINATFKSVNERLSELFYMKLKELAFEKGIDLDGEDWKYEPGENMFVKTGEVEKKPKGEPIGKTNNGKEKG